MLQSMGLSGGKGEEKAERCDEPKAMRRVRDGLSPSRDGCALSAPEQPSCLCHQDELLLSFRGESGFSTNKWCC